MTSIVARPSTPASPPTPSPSTSAAPSTTTQATTTQSTTTQSTQATSTQPSSSAHNAADVDAAAAVTALRGETGQAFLDTGRAAIAAAPALPAATASTADLYAATPMTPTTEQPTDLLGHVAGFGQGLWGGVTDSAGGLWDMGVGAANLTGLNGAEAQAQTQDTLARTAETVVTNPGAVVDAMLQPITEPWNAGRYGEALGRGTFEAVGMLLGMKGVDKVGVLARGADAAGDVVDAAGDVARATDAAGDVVDSAGDAARAADTPAATIDNVDIDTGVGELGGSDPANIKGILRGEDAVLALRKNGISDARTWNQTFWRVTDKLPDTDIDAMATFPDGRYGILVGGDGKGMIDNAFSPTKMAESLEAVRRARDVLTDPDGLGRNFAGVKVMVPANTNRQVIDAFVAELGAANVIPF